MPSLLELQHALLGAILGDRQGIENFLSQGATGTQAGLQIYANTVRTNFLGSLESTYPVVQRLVGQDYFKQAVRRFQQQHPSRGGDLTAAGEHFAPFLRQSLGIEFAYIAEMARLEWLLQDSALAIDGTPFDLQRLAEVPIDDYDRLQFHLHPSTRLFKSLYPCVAIWHANKKLDREPDIIHLEGAPCSVAIVRTQGEIHFHSLAAGEQRLLDAFAGGLPFAAAVRQASTDPSFDATVALQRLVRTEIVVDFT